MVNDATTAGGRFRLADEVSKAGHLPEVSVTHSLQEGYRKALTRMTGSLLPPTSVSHRIVLELRYDQGYLYWDRAGRTVAEIVASNEGWELRQIDGKQCVVTNNEQNLTCTFSHNRMDVSQTQNLDVEELLSWGDFAALASNLVDTVVRNLTLESFRRIGLRAWNLFGAEDPASARQMLHSIPVVSSTRQSLASFGEIHETSLKFDLALAEHMLRVELSTFEQQIKLPPSVYESARKSTHKQPRGQREALIAKLKAEKRIKTYPTFGVVLDLDASIEDPLIPEFCDVASFIEASVESFEMVKERIR